MANSNPPPKEHTRRPQRNILRRLPPSLSIDSAQTPTSRPLTPSEREALTTLNKLKEFLATAPTRWSPPDAPGTIPFPNPSPRPALNRFSLPSNEFVTCVLWQGQYYISGTDIVRSLVFRFEAFGRPVRNMKKFEEGVFSDLRNLKPGSDATLEEPKSSFLDLLYKYQCIRTQKKQKVFYWFSVPHDRLFFDALERDIKRESMGADPASVVTNEPALSFKPNMNSGKTLWEEWMSRVKKLQESGELADELEETVMPCQVNSLGNSQVWAGMFELFEGSPAYKQRRKRRSPVHSRSIDVDESARRHSALVRSNSLNAPQLDLRRDSQQNSYPSPVLNRSTPNVNTSALDIGSSATGYPPSMPFGSTESLDQMPHIVRSQSTTGAQRPMFQSQDSIMTSSPRATYHPYPRPQARMSQNRHCSDPSTTSVVSTSDMQHRLLQPQMPQHLPSDSYAPVHASYAVSQSRQTHTITSNLPSTYSSTNTQSGMDYTSSDSSTPRAFACPTCGKLFQRPENWRNHVNEHSVMGNSKLSKDIVECYTQVHAGQHLEDGPIRPATQYDNLQTAIPNVNAAPESMNYGPGASTMPMSGTSVGWIGSPFSSSGSTLSIPPPSPSSSPSGSSYAPSSGPYKASEYTHGQLRSVEYDTTLTGYFPQHPRPETPGMESRPQTSSSYDSGLNYAIQGRRAAPIDGQYGRHSSAPVTLSSGQNNGVHGVHPSASSLYYNAGGVSYSTSSSNSTVHYSGSPSMEDFHPSTTHMNGDNQFNVTVSESVSPIANPSGYTQAIYNDSPVHATWGTDYYNSPSPPDEYTTEVLQQQQPVPGALYSNSSETMRYFQTSGTS